AGSVGRPANLFHRTTSRQIRRAISTSLKIWEARVSRNSCSTASVDKALRRSMRVVKPGDFSDERVKALLTRHREGMHSNSPPGHVFALDWSGLQKPEISFYAVWEGDALLGVGALKELEPGIGEIQYSATA